MIGLTLDPARRRRDDERNPTGRFQTDDMLYLIVDKLLPLEVYVRESSGTKRSSFSVHLQVDLIFPMRWAPQINVSSGVFFAGHVCVIAPSFRKDLRLLNIAML